MHIFLFSIHFCFCFLFVCVVCVWVFVCLFVFFCFVLDSFVVFCVFFFRFGWLHKTGEIVWFVCLWFGRKAVKNQNTYSVLSVKVMTL